MISRQYSYVRDLCTKVQVLDQLVGKQRYDEFPHRKKESWCGQTEVVTESCQPGEYLFGLVLYALKSHLFLIPRLKKSQTAQSL
jgi:hypothetical protein